MRISERNSNLDVLRAIAIGSVALAHMAVMNPVRRELALTISWIGQFGVDLFFVLSGWLVGGLFWREHAATGTVRWGRFFLRRALRTVPPYLVVLPVAWFAVRLFAPERAEFRWSYLLLLQNYLPQMPYFLVSWSLCVEEHFYLLLPVLTLLTLLRRVPVSLLFFTLFLLSPLCRIFLEDTATIDVFDRSVLSTHLRLEGLVLGFWAARCHQAHPAIWARITGLARWMFWPAWAVVALTPFIPPPQFYALGLTLVSLLLALIVVAAACASPWVFPGRAALRHLALRSYSVYLTHSLVIHFARLLAVRTGGWAEFCYWPLVIGLVLATGWLFYFAIEQPCLRWRDRLVPSGGS